MAGRRGSFLLLQGEQFPLRRGQNCVSALFVGHYTR